MKFLYISKWKDIIYKKYNIILINIIHLLINIIY